MVARRIYHFSFIRYGYRTASSMKLIADSYDQAEQKLKYWGKNQQLILSSIRLVDDYTVWE